MLAYLGLARLGQGDEQATIDCYLQAVVITGENEEQFGEAEVLNGLARVISPSCNRRGPLRA